MTAVTTSHLALDHRGRAVIRDSAGMRVAMLVAAMRADALSAQNLQEQFPHLSLAQIHAALSYYYDNQADIDAQMAQEVAEYERLRADAIATGRQVTKPDKADVMARLKASGQHP